jgi:uncharacterized membrane protein
MTGLGASLTAIHLMAAILWAGGSGFLLLVVAPAGRFSMPLPERVLYFRRLDRAFDSIAYIALALLFLSGALQWLASGRLGAESSQQGLLGVKVALVLVMIGWRILRSSREGPRLAGLAAEAIGESETAPGEELEAVWKRSIRLLALEVLTAIPIVFLGVLLGT